jgi:PhnB protein
LVDFIKNVFSASGHYHPQAPAELRLGDSLVMVSDAGVREPAPACLYVYVPDADAAWQRALDAGAKSIEAPSNMPYGDRRGMVKDRWAIYGKSQRVPESPASQHLHCGRCKV